MSIITYTATSMSWIVAGTLLQGIPCGSFATTASTYIAEICPPAVAGILTAFVSCCWVIGQLLSSGMLWAMVDEYSTDAFRIPMAIQWIIPVPIIIGCYFAPPSPWWLARRGRLSEALDALKRISGTPASQSAQLSQPTPETPPDYSPPETSPIMRLIEIRQVIALEESEMHIGTTYRDCFRKVNLRRLEIAVMTNLGQNIAGFAIASQLVNFMHYAGLDSDDSFKMGFFNSLVLFSGNLFYFGIRSRLSIRTVYISGLSCILPILGLVGLLEWLKREVYISHPTGSWFQAGLLFAWSFIYGGSLSLSPNSVACAVSASNIRTKTLVLSRLASDMTNLVQAAAGPYMLSVEFGNMQGYAAFPAAVAVALWIAWSVFRLPKTDGIPQRIIDHLFQTGVPARRFGIEAQRIQEWEERISRDGNTEARDFDLRMVEQSIAQMGHDSS